MIGIAYRSKFGEIKLYWHARILFGPRFLVKYLMHVASSYLMYATKPTCIYHLIGCCTELFGPYCNVIVGTSLDWLINEPA